MGLDAKVRMRLLEAARQAATLAYAPYSKFKVGAAVLDERGQIHTGANIENSSYGLTVCAERTAIFRAVLSGARRIEAIAVTCPAATLQSGPGESMPCGACRQVIAEFTSAEGAIFVDRVGDFTLAELLPQPFRLSVPSTVS